VLRAVQPQVAQPGALTKTYEAPQALRSQAKRAPEELPNSFVEVHEVA